MFGAYSTSETLFIREGCCAGVRSDGRGLNDMRRISIESNIFPHVAGSARIKLGRNIDVVCAVKFEVSEVSKNKQVTGIDVNVDVSPTCRSTLDDRGLQSIGEQVATNLYSLMMVDGLLDKDVLSIIPGKFDWLIGLDITIFCLDGDPLDACSICAFVALSSSKVPKIDLIVGESGQFEDFEISTESDDFTSLDCSKLPIVVTVVKIAHTLIIDASEVEQFCADAILAISIDSQGVCRGLRFTKAGCMSFDGYNQAIKKAIVTAREMFRNMNEVRARKTVYDVSSNVNGLLM